jgi:hypothetical protein
MFIFAGKFQFQILEGFTANLPVFDSRMYFEHIGINFLYAEVCVR